MSRLTAAQIVALGEYLEPEFEPASLTISQLLGVLGYHNITYPTPYSKGKLVQVFNDEVKRRATKFKKERLKKEHSIASDDGIKDGVTGEYLGRPTAPRRSSRRLSRAPREEEEEENDSPPRPDPPKRRRSSAQPRLGGPSRKAQPPPALAEESEPEEIEPFEPARKVGRKKKSVTAGIESRRVSLAEDSGWDETNIFQSGAESSSPLRPSPARSKGRRSSVVPRKSRKSMSAPPNVSPLHSPAKSPFSPPKTKFQPDIDVPSFDNARFGSPPPRTSGQWNFTSKVYSPPSRSSNSRDVEYEYEDVEEPLRDEDYSGPSYMDDTQPHLVKEFDEVMDDIHQSTLAEEAEELEELVNESATEELESQNEGDIRNAAIQKRIADSGVVATPPQDLLLDEPKPISMLSRLFLLIIFSALSYVTYEYKAGSASIGYCDPGSDTNRVLEELKTQRALIAECNQENRTTLYDSTQDSNSPPCPMITFPFAPESCTPCPEHAHCSGHAVTCHKAYILKSPFFLSFLPPNDDPSRTTWSTSVSPSDMAWKVFSEAFDGLPGLGSVAFPPSCVEDPRRRRHIGALGKGIEALLGQHRGTLLCNAEADRVIKDGEGGEAKRWGMQVNKLKETMREGADPQRVLPNFDDLFNEAVQELVQWGGVLINEDANGERYLAHKTPQLSWTCKLTVKSRDTWNEWRGTVITVSCIVAYIYASTQRRNKKKLEAKRISKLVQIALDALQQQEFAHYTDPVSTAQPFLSSAQLRDLVLQEEHSVSVRQKVWDKVEKIVETNANVRANLEEVYGGDELRVWRWVGSTGGSLEGLNKQIDDEAE